MIRCCAQFVETGAAARGGSPKSRGARSWLAALAGVCAIFACSPAFAQKDSLQPWVRAHEEELWQAALKIWGWAEPGYQEHQSAQLLAGLLERAGFQVKRGVAEIPTAFTAEFGQGKPVIGILGEYDALPGLSQQAIPERQPVVPSGYGHGCGHHLFGVASAGAAMALAEQIRAGTIQGTIRFYGCPAEEGGGAKVFLVRASLFEDCDAVLHWHPGSRNLAGDRRNLARIAVKYRFHGKSAHAAGAPEQGRSALDAVELTNHASQLLREHTPDGTRIHHVVTYGGGAPNVVPDFAEVYYYVRHPRAEVVRDLYRRLTLCAKAGELATETRLEAEYEGGTMEMLPNQTLGRVIFANLKACNDLKYNEEELAFASRLQQTLERPQPLDSIARVDDETDRVSMGSTDVGDVSRVVPTAGFTTVCFVPGVPGHSWQAVACGGTSIARQGMSLAARVLATTAWDLYTQPSVLQAAREEHRRRAGEMNYRPLLEPGQKPPLNYRRSSPTTTSAAP